MYIANLLPEVWRKYDNDFTVELVTWWCCMLLLKQPIQNPAPPFNYCSRTDYYLGYINVDAPLNDIECIHTM